MLESRLARYIHNEVYMHVYSENVCIYQCMYICIYGVSTPYVHTFTVTTTIVYVQYIHDKLIPQSTSHSPIVESICRPVPC